MCLRISPPRSMVKTKLPCLTHRSLLLPRVVVHPLPQRCAAVARPHGGVVLLRVTSRRYRPRQLPGIGHDFHRLIAAVVHSVLHFQLDEPVVVSIYPVSQVIHSLASKIERDIPPPIGQKVSGIRLVLERLQPTAQSLTSFCHTAPPHGRLASSYPWSFQDVLSTSCTLRSRKNLTARRPQNRAPCTVRYPEWFRRHSRTSNSAFNRRGIKSFQ